MDEPENTNVFQYNSKWGFGVYNWKLDDERNSLACISDANVNDVFKRVSPDSFKHLKSFHIYITRSGNDIHLRSENIVDDGVSKSQTRINREVLFWSLTSFSS